MASIDPETPEDRERRLDTQAKIIRELLPFLPLPRVLWEETEGAALGEHLPIRNAVEATRSDGVRRAVRMVRDAGAQLRAFLLGSADMIGEWSAVDAGMAITAAATITHTVEHPRYTLTVTWGYESAVIHWDFKDDGPYPELVAVLESSGNLPLAMMAVPPAPAGIVTFNREAGVFEPTGTPWKVHLFILR